MNWNLVMVAVCWLGLALSAAPVFGADIRTFPSPRPTTPLPLWNRADLEKIPRTFPVEESVLSTSANIRPLFFESIPYKGSPTRVFAWVGIPASAQGKVPGIVLVHGGGGTAYRDWVRIWVERGYAAIAMDTTGGVPISGKGMKWTTSRHEFSGPAFGAGGPLCPREPFEGALDPIEDQWMYHAVAAVVRGHSLLRSLPEVDADRIGITGISWGGVITELAASTDPRFRFAAPVYGCGFLGENSSWLESSLRKIPEEMAVRWIALWDPSQYLPQARMPFLFCNGTNDRHFRPDSWQKTYRCLVGPTTLSFKVRMAHDHPPAGDPLEIAAFADAIVRGGAPLTKIISSGNRGNEASVQWQSSAQAPINKVELVYTADSGNWVERTWKVMPITLLLSGHTGTATASIPGEATAYYFNLQDSRGCIVSSEHEVREK